MGRIATLAIATGLVVAVAPSPAGAADPARYAAIETAIDSAIAAFLDAEPEIGARATSSVNALTAAKASVSDAAEDDAGGDPKAASKALRKAGRRVRGVGFRMRSLRARKTISPEIREPLAALVRSIEQDIRGLWKDL